MFGGFLDFGKKLRAFTESKSFKENQKNKPTCYAIAGKGLLQGKTSPSLQERIHLTQRIRFLEDQKNKMVCNSHADLVMYSHLTNQINDLEAKALNQAIKDLCD